MRPASPTSRWACSPSGSASARPPCHKTASARAAGLRDETGFAAATRGLRPERLGIRPPSLYKHVASLADLQHRLATLAMTEVGEQIRDAVQGLAGRDALAAL